MTTISSPSSSSDITQPNAPTIPAGSLSPVASHSAPIAPTSTPTPIQPTFPAQAGHMPSPLTRFIVKKARGGWKPVLVLDGGVLMERPRKRGPLLGLLFFLLLCVPPTGYALWLIADIMVVVIREQNSFANVGTMAGGLGVAAVFVLLGILGALISLLPMNYWRGSKQVFFDAAKVQAEAQRV